MGDRRRNNNSNNNKDEHLLDEIIRKLLALADTNSGMKTGLDYDEIHFIIMKARQILMEQPMLLELCSPMMICGDMHGQYSDLVRLFEFGGHPSQSNYLFLGDYVDRGDQSIETICLLLAYKIKYPENFFLLRGNHECTHLNSRYGFFDECKRRYNVKIFKFFNECFNCLPIAATIEDRIFCCHGGLSPELNSMEQIRQIKRPTDVPRSGIMCDLLWSDPSSKTSQWAKNRARGISYTFGAKVVTQFLDKFDFDLVCRAHEVVPNGFKFFANRQLVTIFSAPNYEDYNSGAILNINEDLKCTFKVMKPEKRKRRRARTA